MSSPRSPSLVEDVCQVASTSAAADPAGDKAAAISPHGIRSRIDDSCRHRSTLRALALFLPIALSYLATLTASVVAPSWTLRFASAGINGIVLSVLFVLGHDACHGSFTPSRWLNAVLGRLALLPSWHPFAGWPCPQSCSPRLDELASPRLRLGSHVEGRIRSLVTARPMAPAALPIGVRVWFVLLLGGLRKAHHFPVAGILGQWSPHDAQPRLGARGRIHPAPGRVCVGLRAVVGQYGITSRGEWP